MQVIWNRWSEVDSLLAEALERPPDARARFLADSCGGDLELLHAVTDLVTASQEAEPDVSGPAEALLRRVFALGPEGPAGIGYAPGVLIGHYRIVRELGRGGMATVYEAERADGAYEQRVALKLLRRGTDSEDAFRRFHLETQVLSTLAHPNVARLFDAGVTGDGYPYLIMELVEGMPLTDWADHRRLTIAARLGLFLQVADAVSFAHQHLVVHRDIKPSNVLVGADGQVKLLDFGIAKLLEADPGPDSETQPTARWMTPGYASPEQVLGHQVTTSTDVHGLGVLLYELLAGCRPFGADGIRGFALETAICEQVPERPSIVAGARPGVAEARATPPERLRRILAGDLDAIVSKALRKIPSERYATVSALAGDLERHRAGFPAEAGSGLRIYRLRKFVGRHWLAVGTAVGVAVVVLGSAVSLFQMQRTSARARDEAIRAAEDARLVTGFLADVFRGRDPDRAPPDTVTARTLLAWGEQRVESEFVPHPALQRDLYGVLASAYSNLGLLDRSIELRTRALALARTISGNRSEDAATHLLSLSKAERDSRDGSAAVLYAREAVDIRIERLAPGDPRIAEAMTELGTAWALMGQPDSAAPVLQGAIDILRARNARDDVHYLAALLALAPVRRAQGDFDDARRLYDEAIPKYRALDSSRIRLASHLNNHAYLLRLAGEHERAEQGYREALGYLAVRGRGHPGTLMVAGNLASVLELQGKIEEAEAVLRESVAGVRVLWPGGHWQVGSQHAMLGRLLLRSQQFDEALAELQLAHASHSATIGAGHLWTWFVEATIAAGNVARGRADLGQPYLDRFYQLRLESLPGPTELGRRQDLDDQLSPFVRVLRALGLASEATRFHALLSPQRQRQDGPPT